MISNICQKDSLEFLKEQKDFSLDIIYADPPYALGSKVIIRLDGKPDYEKASDFMNKWDTPTGDFWEKWFAESFRTLKYGGYCILFGMDRQLFLFKYYAVLSHFEERQSLYWYFISSFPKSADLSKNIDNYFKAKRKIIGSRYAHDIRKRGIMDACMNDIHNRFQYEYTLPETLMAKKYGGYKYSIAPLKQTNETIMIFQKPYLTGSCLYDVLAYENGNERCCCGALSIDKNRCNFASDEDKQESTAKNQHEDFKTKPMTNNNAYGDFSMVQPKNYHSWGRYPAQTFIECTCNEVINCNKGAVFNPNNGTGLTFNSEIHKFGFLRGFQLAPRCYKDFQIHTSPDCPCAILDKQSGVKQNNGHWSKLKVSGYGEFGGGKSEYFGVGGKLKSDEKCGCSKILHKCQFEKGEYDLYLYCPKANITERNAGLNEFDEQKYIQFQTGNGCSGEASNWSADRNTVYKNVHPTLKPISLNKRILSLFKTPNPQKICYPFAGVFSEVIGGYLAGFDDFCGCEINNEYIKIGNARFDYWIAKHNANILFSQKQQTLLQEAKNE